MDHPPIDISGKDGPYRTILADPPWRFLNRTGKIAPEHERLKRYGTLPLEEILNLHASASILASRMSFTKSSKRAVLGNTSNCSLDTEGKDGRSMVTNSPDIDAAMIARKKAEAHRYRGVTYEYEKGRDRFRAQIVTAQRKIRSRRTQTVEQAARLYDEMAIGHFREKAILNFPEDA